MLQIDRTTRRLDASLAAYDAPLAKPLREQRNFPEHLRFFRGLLFATALGVPLWAAMLFAAWWML